jgi:hypothetical protein
MDPGSSPGMTDKVFAGDEKVFAIDEKGLCMR